MFEDLDLSIADQVRVLGPILERQTGKNSAVFLDCACGIRNGYDRISGARLYCGWSSLELNLWLWRATEGK